MAFAEVRIDNLAVASRALSKALEMTVQEVGNLTLETVKNKHGSPNASNVITPVKTGFTRDQWTLNYKKRQFEVANRVPWIGKLEAGASRQAPKGIIGPTLTTVKGKLK
jgi:hypothetical protein